MKIKLNKLKNIKKIELDNFYTLTLKTNISY